MIKTITTSAILDVEIHVFITTKEVCHKKWEIKRGSFSLLRVRINVLIIYTIYEILSKKDFLKYMEIYHFNGCCCIIRNIF